LCECLKSMVSTLELLLVKGDYNLERQIQTQEFNLENYLKLFYEIRRLVIPKLEAAESCEFSFEWKNQDYKQVMYTTRELMKTRKSNNFKTMVEKTTPQEKKGGPSHCSSKANSCRSQNLGNNTTYNYSVSANSVSNVPSELNSVKDGENPLTQKPQAPVVSKSTDLKSTRASSQLQNEYVPMQNRIDTCKDDEQFDPICSEEFREELFNQRNHIHGGKLTESTGNFDQLVNIGTSGSVHKHLGMNGGMADTMDKYLGGESHKELPTFKNYDLPLMA
jgi:hypothetical protein